MSEKTEAPTARRLQKSREDGQAAVSREFTMLASLGAGLLALGAQIAADPHGPALWLASLLRDSGGDSSTALRHGAEALFVAVTPVGLAAAAGLAAATFLQTGFLVHLAALQPDLSRIGPGRGLKRLFGPDAAMAAAKAVIKLAALAACLWFAVKRLQPRLITAPFWPQDSLLHEILRQAVLIGIFLLSAQAVIALADLFWTRLRHVGRLRMSLQEVRDEQKESDGNPQVKGRMRQIARSRARRRMMASVPKAAVVITNPTHYAIALAYERGGSGAPKLVAKGADEMAARIRDAARVHHIPMVANPPLARALYRIELDTEIPAEHFRAVAEVIAYVWRMRTRTGRL